MNQAIIKVINGSYVFEGPGSGGIGIQPLCFHIFIFIHTHARSHTYGSGFFPVINMQTKKINTSILKTTSIKHFFLVLYSRCFFFSSKQNRNKKQNNHNRNTLCVFLWHCTQTLKTALEQCDEAWHFIGSKYHMTNTWSTEQSKLKGKKKKSIFWLVGLSVYSEH